MKFNYREKVTNLRLRDTSRTTSLKPLSTCPDLCGNRAPTWTLSQACQSQTSKISSSSPSHSFPAVMSPKVIPMLRCR